MKYGKFLKENQVIKFISPSLGCTTEPYFSRLKKAQETFENNNFIVSIGEYCYKNEFALASSKENLAKEFENSYLDNNSNFLLSVAGGELQNLILDLIDTNKIGNAYPKWFMGYSDNTNLCFFLTVICDVASIYGPTATHFGTEELHESLTDALALINGKKLKFNNYSYFELESLKNDENPFMTFNLTEKSIPKNHFKKNNLSLKGRIIGGCLDILTLLIGNPFNEFMDKFLEKYKNDGFIWYIESCDINSVAVIRSLTLLKRNNWFKYVKGFLIGRPFLYQDESFGIKIQDAFINSLKEYNVPIIYDLAFGHIKPMFPIINGSIALIEYEEDNFTIEYVLE